MFCHSVHLLCVEFCLLPLSVITLCTHENFARICEQTDRQSYRQITKRQTNRQTDKETERKKERKKERQNKKSNQNKTKQNKSRQAPRKSVQTAATCRSASKNGLYSSTFRWSNRRLRASRARMRCTPPSSSRISEAS